MKGLLTGFQTVAFFLSTVAVALAAEAKPAEEAAGNPYAALYMGWYILIGIILAWGIYDSFFRPID